jgi:hypothetical protein
LRYKSTINDFIKADKIFTHFLCELRRKGEEENYFEILMKSFMDREILNAFAEGDAKQKVKR